MARPVWHDAGDDPSAVADLLERAAGSAELRFDDRAAPKGTDARVLHQAAMLVAKKRLAESHSEADRLVAESVRALDDLARASNLLGERLAEWAGLYAPEAVRAADDAAKLASLLAEGCSRDIIMERLGLTGPSIGSELAEEDLSVLRGFAASIDGLHKDRARIEARVEALMRDLAPNVTALAGPVVGGRLLAQAGSLQRLATMSSGTLQTLGAETALFRHIKEGTKPPKHGILFQHPSVFQAPPWQRGAVARAYSIQLVKAARADAFTHNDIAADLQAALDDDLSRIAKRPRPKPKGSRREGGGGRRGPPRGGKGGKGGKGPKRKGGRR